MPPRMFGKDNPVKPKFTAEALAEGYKRYCEWLIANPIPTEQILQEDGTFVPGKKHVPRPPTNAGFAAFMHTTLDTLTKCRLYEGTREVMEVIYDHIVAGQQEGSIAGVYNGNFVARLLGMEERVEMVLSDAVEETKVDRRNIAELVHPDCTDADLDAIYAAGLEPLLYSQAQLEAGVPWMNIGVKPQPKPEQFQRESLTKWREDWQWDHSVKTLPPPPPSHE